MLLQGFFRVKPFNPKVIPETTIYTKNTPGSYSYAVPEKYNYVIIEIAGASGSPAYAINASNKLVFVGSGGKGSIKRMNKIIITNNRTITGVIGATPVQEVNKANLGGSGYQNGENGTINSISVFPVAGGGGGGSSSALVNNELITVGGGGGTGVSQKDNYKADGGAGGGPNGGAKGTGPVTSKENIYGGYDATDSPRAGLNTGNGYIKIWGGYNPYYN